ncbi:MAG TPA: CDF family Co(II)/Ni(II) efflux transporter DmeF [Stellaceae bacterium]|jgi:cation diffusion facilitator family transporter|nr:CDF family Co(II)/Ni(II) efflux transporter DmeF [Stellaceae bacterium]
MTETGAANRHIFLGTAHETNERRTWWVIALCGVMMAAEIGGGLLFGSIALVADGLHMSTHAGALLMTALAYRYARRHAQDARFAWSTGKLGDLAGFSSALVLAMIALLIAYEGIDRLMTPKPIDFAQAIPIAALGFVVNLASLWLLNGGMHHHDHGHHHHHHGDHDHDDDADHHRHDHGARDNNMRAAFIHIMADAAVSVIVVVGLGLGWLMHWEWTDPIAGLIGASVVAAWSYSLLRDTGSVLLDMTPDHHVEAAMRRTIEEDGDRVDCLHLWRLGPGHLGATVTVTTRSDRDARFYRSRLAHIADLAHLTVEVVGIA